MSAAVDTLQQALERHQAGDLDRAETLYQDVLRVDPAHADALHLLGVAAHQRNQHHVAADYIAQAIQVNASTALYHSNLGACYRAMGRLPQAIDCFREAISRAPEFAGAHYNLGMALESSGELDEAVLAYREALRLDPEFVDAWNNLGNLYAAQEEFEHAIESFQRILELIPEFGGIHYNLANALAGAGRLHEAIDAYREAIRLEPNMAEAHNNLGAVYKDLGRLDEAAECFARSIELNPEYTEAQYNLANVGRMENRGPATIEQLREAVRKSPHSAELHASLGKALEEAESYEEAAESFQRAVDLDPRHAPAHFGLGYACLSQGKHEEARLCYERGLAVDRANASAWNNLGSIYNSNDDLDDALACFKTAAAINPDNAKVHFNIGNIHKERWNIEEAVAAYRRAIERDPGLADPHINLGVLLQNQGRLDEAIEAFDRAVSLDAEGSGAHFHRSLARLLKGDLAEGWREYQWRWKYYNTDRGFTAPVWDGKPLGDETLLIYGEQGVGDELMFASCFGDVVGQTAACIIECDTRLVPLFARSFPLARVIGRRGDTHSAEAAPLPHFDRQIPAGSLPGYFRDSQHAFPRQRRYLAPDPQRVAEWRSRYAALGPGPTVGISWRGGHDPKIRRRRSTSLDQWEAVLTLPGIQFVNLQYGDCREDLESVRRQLGVTIHDWDDADPLSDLDGFAAQVAALDLVISTDNATVHVAGARGAPVWTLLPFAPNWRWMLHRHDTLWYQSMRLIRQPAPNDWNTVFQQAAEELADLARSHKPGRRTAEPRKPDARISDPPESLGADSAEPADRHTAESSPGGGRGAPAATPSSPSPPSPLSSILTSPLSDWREDPETGCGSRLRIDDMLEGVAPAEYTPATEIPSIVFDRSIQFDPPASGYSDQAAAGELNWQTPPGERPPAPDASARYGPTESVSAAGTPVTADGPAPIESDPVASREKHKYEKMWTVNSYRAFSPGLAAVDKYPFLEMFRELGVQTILDAGCGSGKLMQKLMIDHGDEFRVHGFDISENCLDPFFDDIKNEILTVGCLWNPDDLTVAYDAVVCTDVMEHIPTEHVPQVLSNLRKCTKKGCYLAIALVDDNFGRNFLGEPLHLTVQKPQWWFGKLAAAGFHIDGHAVESDAKGRDLVLHVFATPK